MKIRKILEVLLLYDPSIETNDEWWEFNGQQRKIKKFEEFPYYLYKAIWDDDFHVSSFFLTTVNIGFCITLLMPQWVFFDSLGAISSPESAFNS